MECFIGFIIINKNFHFLMVKNFMKISSEFWKLERNKSQPKTLQNCKEIWTTSKTCSKSLIFIQNLKKRRIFGWILELWWSRKRASNKWSIVWPPLDLRRDYVGAIVLIGSKKKISDSFSFSKRLFIIVMDNFPSDWLSFLTLHFNYPVTCSRI